jgi:hypothetical protein
VQLRDFIPWRAFDIRTRWAPEIAAIELKKAIDQGSLLGRGETASFVGDVRGPRKFRFRRRVGYRNAFLPIIREGGDCAEGQLRPERLRLPPTTKARASPAMILLPPYDVEDS